VVTTASIADIAAVLVRERALVLGHLSIAAEFLQVQTHANVQRYLGKCCAICRPRAHGQPQLGGPAEEQLHERHDAQD
jgi:hypothetical protein